MNIIENIEKSEILGYITVIINDLENKIEEVEKDIIYLEKKTIFNTSRILKIKLNDSFSKTINIFNNKISNNRKI